MNFRPLTIADIESVMTLEQSLPDSLSWKSATVDEQLPIIENGNEYGVFENTILIGKVGFEKSETNTWHVDGLIIANKFRGKQYGSQLFTYALEQCINKEHPTTLELFVYPKNSSAISLYLKNGFVIKEWINNKYGEGKHRLKLIKQL